MYFLFKLQQDVPMKKHNWRYPGTNWFNNDIDVFRKKAGENLDEYIQTYNLSVDYFIRSYLKEENEENGERFCGIQKNRPWSFNHMSKLFAPTPEQVKKCPQEYFFLHVCKFVYTARNTYYL